MNNTDKPKVVLDTNVYISAIISAGKPRMILELAQKGRIELLISEYILSEIDRILRKKLKMIDWKTEVILNAIGSISKLVFPNFKLAIIEKHDTDNRIIECALEGNADFIVSGDRRHILPIGEYCGIKILSPDEFLTYFQ